MGQTYSVDMKIIFKNEDAKMLFCNSIKDYIEKTSEKTAIYQLEGLNLDNPFDCFKAMTYPRAEEEDGIWCADFDASYGWESVLFDGLGNALKFAEDGSYLYVFPDNYSVYMDKKDGKIITRTVEDEEDEEE